MQFFQLILNVLIFPLYALFGSAGIMLFKIALNSRNEDSQLINIIFTFKFILGFAFYGISFLLWIYILSRYKVNIAYPISVSLFFIITALGSYFILNEPFGIYKIIGFTLCLVGILLIAKV